MAEPCWGRESQWHALHAHECRGNKKDTARPEAEQKGGRWSRSDPFRPVRKKWSFLEKSGHFLEKSGSYVVPAAGRGHELPVETPILPDPHSSCADSDWACHTGHPAPTTSDARTCSRHGPQITRSHAPAGHDRSGCTSLRPAGTYPRAKNVHGPDDPGITSRL